MGSAGAKAQDESEQVALADPDGTEATPAAAQADPVPSAADGDTPGPSGRAHVTVQLGEAGDSGTPSRSGTGAAQERSGSWIRPRVSIVDSGADAAEAQQGSAEPRDRSASRVSSVFKWFGRLGGGDERKADMTVTVTVPPKKKTVMEEFQEGEHVLAFFSTEELEQMAGNFFKDKYPEYTVPLTMPGRREHQIGWNSVDVRHQHRLPRMPQKADWGPPHEEEEPKLPRYSRDREVVRGNLCCPMRLRDDEEQERFEFICHQMQYNNAMAEKRGFMRSAEAEAERKKNGMRLRATNDDPIFVANFRNISLAKGERVVRLCGALQFCNTLVALCLNGAGLKEASVKQLSQALADNTTLTRLEVGGNRLGPQGAAHIRDLLASNRRLQHLDVSLNSLGDVGCEHICQGILSNRPDGPYTKIKSNIQFLNLSTNQLGAYSGYYLSRLIRDFENLNVLQLWRNSLGTTPRALDQDGFAFIADVMSHAEMSGHLKHLDVSYNGIKESTFDRLVSPLEEGLKNWRRKSRAASIFFGAAKALSASTNRGRAGGFTLSGIPTVGSGSIASPTRGWRSVAGRLGAPAESFAMAEREDTGGSMGGRRTSPMAGQMVRGVSVADSRASDSEDELPSPTQMHGSTIGRTATVQDRARMKIDAQIEQVTGQRLTAPKKMKRHLVITGNFQSREMTKRLMQYFNMGASSWDDRAKARSRFARIVRDVTRPRIEVPEGAESTRTFMGRRDNNVWTYEVKRNIKETKSQRLAEERQQREREEREREEEERRKRMDAEQQFLAENPDFVPAAGPRPGTAMSEASEWGMGASTGDLLLSQRSGGLFAGFWDDTSRRGSGEPGSRPQSRQSVFSPSPLDSRAQSPAGLLGSTTGRSMRMSVRGSIRPLESYESLRPDSPPPDAEGGIDQLREDVAYLANELLEIQGVIKNLSEMGSPSDEDLAALEEAWQEYKDRKLAVAELLRERLPAHRKMPPHDGSETSMQDLLSTLCREGDQRPGSVELVAALLDRVDLDFGEVIERDQLIAQQCADGNRVFLRMLLEYPGSAGRYGKADVVGAACFSQTARIPLVAIVLPRVGMDADTAEELSDIMQDFVFDICYARSAIPKEDRSGRLELVRALLTHDLIRIAPNAEAPAGGTLFSRACLDGDMELMKLLIEVLPPDATDATHVLEDSTTPLLQAVISKNLGAVNLALSRPGARRAVELPDAEGNTPVSMAQLMQRQDIVDALTR
eukprot:TRINITY_DN1628_c11_g1_i1.p1 TRINITY_DN1628_c11_g1~~TRINITY_DN1628_c11_g1_i1.p1  ORF type:complete len:1232 (+),score=435.44 TRINITY_DN1628_c11_g1_i1:62-3757(+)